MDSGAGVPIEGTGDLPQCPLPRLHDSPTALQQVAGLKIQDLSGRPAEFAPHTSGSVTASYDRVLPAAYHMTAEVTETFSSAYYLTGVDDDLAMRAPSGAVEHGA